VRRGEGKSFSRRRGGDEDSSCEKSWRGEERGDIWNTLNEALSGAITFSKEKKGEGSGKGLASGASMGLCGTRGGELSSTTTKGKKDNIFELLRSSQSSPKNNQSEKRTDLMEKKRVGNVILRSTESMAR